MLLGAAKCHSLLSFRDQRAAELLHVSLLALPRCLSKQAGKTAYVVYFNWKALGKSEFEGSLHVSLEANRGFMSVKQRASGAQTQVVEGRRAISPPASHFSLYFYLQDQEC